MSQIPTSPNTQPATVADGSVHRPAGDSEEVYYEGTPQLRGHLGQVSLYWILGIAIILIPLLIAVYFKVHIPWWANLALVAAGIILMIVPILTVKRTRYRITNYRIDFERGWLSTTIDTMELWHVEDLKFHQSLFERLVSVGTIEIFSHDDTSPNLYMRGIPNARQLFSTLQQRIIAVKRQRGVLKVDSGT